MMKRRDALKEMLAPISERPVPDPHLSRVPVKPGALKSMGLSLQNLSDEAESAHALRERLEAGEVVIEIDPQSIVPSFIRDRLAEFPTNDVSDLEVSIAESGQQVPILVRPSPQIDGQYQVAYGHRRVEACRRLGRPVKAIVRRLTDQELVTAQGKENLEREDLSFIERAIFAARLEDRGFDRSVLMAALGVHKGNSLYDDCRCEGRSGGVDPGDWTGPESWPPSLGAICRHVSPLDRRVEETCRLSWLWPIV